MATVWACPAVPLIQWTGNNEQEIATGLKNYMGVERIDINADRVITAEDTGIWLPLDHYVSVSTGNTYSAEDFNNHFVHIQGA